MSLTQEYSILPFFFSGRLSLYNQFVKDNFNPIELYYKVIIPNIEDTIFNIPPKYERNQSIVLTFFVVYLNYQLNLKLTENNDPVISLNFQNMIEYTYFNFSITINWEYPIISNLIGSVKLKMLFQLTILLDSKNILAVDSVSKLIVKKNQNSIQFAIKIADQIIVDRYTIIEEFLSNSKISDQDQQSSDIHNEIDSLGNYMIQELQVPYNQNQQSLGKQRY